MEYLDTYDENGKFLEARSREDVHKLGLWHKTIHCWLYDKKGNIYFQIRAEEQKFYTTASGHVDAGETIKEAFGREIREEIGVEVDQDKATLVDVVVWTMDKEKADGSVFKDRVFANVYVSEFNEANNSFSFDLNEVSGLVKVNAKEALEMFTREIGEIAAEIITPEGVIKRNVKFEEFLVNKHETALGKYGDILNKVISLLS